MDRAEHEFGALMDLEICSHFQDKRLGSFSHGKATERIDSNVIKIQGGQKKSNRKARTEKGKAENKRKVESH
jgi:hypothetical protein